MVCGKQRSIYVFYDGCNTWINSFLFYLSALLGLSIGPASRYLDRQVLPRVIILALLPLESLPFFSGFWPYTKVYLMLFALFAPRNILPVDSRCSTPKSIFLTHLDHALSPFLLQIFTWNFRKSLMKVLDALVSYISPISKRHPPLFFVHY